MYSYLHVAILVIALFLMGGNAHAWEFSLSGNYSLEYWYLARTGPNDLFGNVNQVALSNNNSGLTTIGFAGPYNNQVVVEGLSSKGADGSFVQEKLQVNPILTINPAVKIFSRVSFQGDPSAPAPNWASPAHYDGGWRSYQRSEETKQGLVIPVLNYVYGQWIIPWGSFWFGRKPFGFGTGWSGLHQEDTTVTAFGIKVPLGPFQLEAIQEFGQTGSYNGPYNITNVDKSLRTLVTSTDRNQQRRWGSFYSMAYDNGPMSIGIGSQTYLWNNVHTYPQGLGTLRDDRSNNIPALFLNSFINYSTNNGQDNSQFPIYGDVFLETAIFYAKYYDGRFYANLEFDQQVILARRLSGRPISGYPRSWFANGGVVLGPAKLDLGAIYRSGHDRSGGVLDVVSTTGTNQTTATQVSNTWNQYVVVSGGGECLRPYSTLIGFYGAGNNGYDAVGNPTFLDFKGYAGRVDYAIAANLNLWASYLYARRSSSTSSWWGQYTGGIGNIPTRGSNVPDNNLGWEAQVGLNWQLLDSTLLSSKVAYWQPGAWFKHAYQDFSAINSIQDPNSNVSIQLNPDRAIDPLLAITVGFEISI